MNVSVFVSLLITVVVLVGMVTVVASSIHRARNVSTRPATKSGVLFVVSNRKWQVLVLEVIGLVIGATGIVLVVLSIVLGGSALGGGPPGVVFVLAGLILLWMGHGVSRARLEVTPDSVWVFRWSGAPREVPLRAISRLDPLTRNNYGGVAARSPKRRLFSASRLMLGYPQLIDYLHTNRADLPIPDTSWPF